MAQHFIANVRKIESPIVELAGSLAATMITNEPGLALRYETEQAADAIQPKGLARAKCGC